MPLSLILMSLIAAATPAVADAGARAPACQEQTFETARFEVCAYAPAHDALVLKPAKGRRNGGLGALKAELGARAETVRFAMNAGMYAPDRTPVGLLIVNGRTAHPADLGEGRGNFYLKPNGVFWTDPRGHAHLEATASFVAHAPAALWATQSGPLVLEAGAINPSLQPDGASRLVRNGVCVDGSGGARFLISRDRVSFGRFARMMRDGLGCQDGLYLDGSVSSLWDPASGRLDVEPDLGPLVVVFGR